MRILAAEGYTTIAVNYTIGPEGVYPLAVHQLNEALAYIDAHAEELGVDASRSCSPETPPARSWPARWRP
jgi:acetyl esterase/lipase